MTIAFRSRGARLALLYALGGPVSLFLVIVLGRLAGCTPGPEIAMQCAYIPDGMHLFLLVVSAAAAVYVTPGLVLLSAMLEILARRSGSRRSPSPDQPG